MKCKEYKARPQAGWNKGRTPPASERSKITFRHIENSIAQAEFIGWPALADSFRCDLIAAQAKARGSKS